MMKTILKSKRTVVRFQVALQQTNVLISQKKSSPGCSADLKKNAATPSDLISYLTL